MREPSEEELLELARAVCMEAHEGQYDKAGADYWRHPFAVAEMVEGGDAKVVAYLHDVVEDTRVTLADLEDMGFPARVVGAVAAMTHAKGEPYADYVERIAGNATATEVKLADLAHNMDLSRTGGVRAVSDEKWAKYEEARERLAAARAERV